MIGSIILERTPAACTRSMAWYSTWPRALRMVYGMTQVPRDIERISKAIHRPERDIERAAWDLLVNGYLKMTFSNKRSLHMDAVLLRTSFNQVVDKDAFAVRFYQHVFASSSEARYLFMNTDMVAQRRSLMATIEKVIRAVEEGDVTEGEEPAQKSRLTTILENLGREHAGKGVKPEHYPVVGAALLATFAETLGPAWTPGKQEAWAEAYHVVSSAMIDGATAHD